MFTCVVSLWHLCEPLNDSIWLSWAGAEAEASERWCVEVEVEVEDEDEEEEDDDDRVRGESAAKLAEGDTSPSHWLTSSPLMSISTLKKSRMLQ